MLSPSFGRVKEAKHLPELLTQHIEHFFSNDADLEPGKWVKIDGWGSADEAREKSWPPWRPIIGN